MNQQAVSQSSSHAEPGDTEFKGGGLATLPVSRSGIADATGGQVIAIWSSSTADLSPEEGTGWHKQRRIPDRHHDRGLGALHCMRTSRPRCRPATVHPRAGITHYLYDYSEDMEYLEIVSRLISRPSTCRRPSTRCRRRPPEVTCIVPGRINLVVGCWLRPIVVVLRCGAPPRIANDISAVNNGAWRRNSDSGAICSIAVPNVKIARGCVAFWHNAR